MTIFFLCVLFFLLLRIFHRKLDILAPDRVFVLVYSMLFAVYGLKLSRFQSDWNVWTYVALWGGSLCFLAGFWWTRILFRTHNNLISLDNVVTNQALASDALDIDWTWFLVVYYLCVGVFLVTFGYAYLETGIIPALAKYPDQARITFLSSSEIIEKGWFFGVVSLMLLVEVVMYSRLPGRVLALAIGLGALVLLLYLSLVTRGDLFRFIVFAVVHYHYGKKRLTLKLLGGLTLLSFGFFLAAMFIRVDAGSTLYFMEHLKIRMPVQLAWIVNPYAYIVSNFWNLDYALSKYFLGDGYYPTTFGLELMKPILYLTKLEIRIGDTFGMDTPYNESICKISGLNTVVFLWHFFKDFGWFGVFGLSLSAGIGAGLLYVNTVLKPTLLKVSLFGVVIGLLILSFMVPMWEFWFVYLNVGVYLLAHKRKKAGYLQGLRFLSVR